MDSALHLHVRPTLRDPALVLAFEGWNDAGEAATAAARYLTEAVHSVPLAEIDPEEFFDFTVRRPDVRLDGGEFRSIEWPTYRFRYGSASADRELIVGMGPEPHLRWRAFCDLMMDFVGAMGARRVALLGAYQADVLYSLPVGVTGFASGQAPARGLAIEPSGYEGPTGIIGVLGDRMRREGLEVVSLWAGLPHYIRVSPNPRGALALLQKVTQYMEFRVDQEPLCGAAAEFEERISALVASDPALTEYVKELKRREFAQ